MLRIFLAQAEIFSQVIDKLYGFFMAPQPGWIEAKTKIHICAAIRPERVFAAIILHGYNETVRKVFFWVEPVADAVPVVG